MTDNVQPKKLSTDAEMALDYYRQYLIMQKQLRTLSRKIRGHLLLAPNHELTEIVVRAQQLLKDAYPEADESEADIARLIASLG